MTPTDNFNDLLALMATLRQECPWDKKQTNNSLQKYAIEEVFELIEAIGADDGSAYATNELKGELGDVLLQVIFHAHLYNEQGRFDMGDVIYHLQEKLIRRHPHVFDKENLITDDDVKRRWDEIKAIENQGKPKRLLSDVKAGTALNTAQNLTKQASTVGFDWDNLQGVLDKLSEEMDEFKDELPSGDFAYQTEQLDKSQKDKISDELGDVLFVLSNVARHLGIDAEMALHGANAKFRRRFAYIETSLLSQGKDFKDSDLAEMDSLWDKAKAYEKQ
ncbi:nucleoside triphosphate pyrophosphohydrolase [Moraxella nasovis]|uniref:nucleoside triphosphate pyrophosphohydrolase n=1 Tax=Moraxella nasovis TaxID=2904121 RepID=UPI001F6133A6|nr:nucleoside triphosphate pyrophosphohydrolase [Moraxella nasovis]UNU74298.1 nucleoside triphosphate pyrophosphohydrolase [Moraxella nasovis]